MCECLFLVMSAVTDRVIKVSVYKFNLTNVLLTRLTEYTKTVTKMMKFKRAQNEQCISSMQWCVPVRERHFIVSHNCTVQSQ